LSQGGRRTVFVLEAWWVSFLPTTFCDAGLWAWSRYFFHDLFLSGLVSRLVFGRRACYRLVWLFSIPADSPKDRRGIRRVWKSQA